VNSLKEAVIKNLKKQLIYAVRWQYRTDPEQVKRADIDKNTNYAMKNPFIKIKCQIGRISKEKLKQLLQEIKDEVIRENIQELKSTEYKVEPSK
jgi:hypothetical protein